MTSSSNLFCSQNTVRKIFYANEYAAISALTARQQQSVKVG